MAPKSKNSSKNAFSIFMDDYVKKERSTGRNISKKIAAEECGLLWKNLSDEQKKSYQTRAAAFKKGAKSDSHNKYTNTGMNFLEYETIQNELKKKAEKADFEIKSTISNLDKDSLKTHLFYIIHCNYYCKTENGTYVPGEIAIVEFSLQDGIKRTYHTLVDPGPIPLGYAYEAKQTSEDIHNLPIPPYAAGESDYLEISNQILRFLEPGKLPDGRYPPLYTLENNIKPSENILQILSDNEDNGSDYFNVFLLHKMFFYLKNKCAEFSKDENVGFPVLSSAIDEIEKDIFCYVPGISCEFHLTLEEKYQNCSLSIVQRYVYLICDHCCQELGIDLIPEKHCRKKAKRNNYETFSRQLRSSSSLHSSPLSKVLDSDERSDFTSCSKGYAASSLSEEFESRFRDWEFSKRSSKISKELFKSVSSDPADDENEL